jgi:hypothetical protein
MKKSNRSFNDTMHVYGRLWTAVAIVMLLLAPLMTALYFNTLPQWNTLLAAIVSICLIYLPSSIVEVITYAPMLGTGATYLAFVTGNLTNLKIPCAMNAREICATKFGTKENEIVSTLSVAVSALTTCTVLALGVLLLVPLSPLLASPALAPAFNTVVPALFGALGCKYFTKSPMIAAAPFAVMAVLCLAVPSLAGQVALLVPVSAALSIAAARILYKKGVVK